MPKILIYALLFFLFPFHAYPQYGTEAEVRNVDFRIVDDNMEIYFDLLSQKSSDRFNISVNIYTENGIKIDAQSFSGNLNNIVPGRRKKVIWHMSDDISYINDQLYVEVMAKHLNPKTPKKTTRIEALFLSTLYPGWGSARTTLKKAHYMKGVVAYGLVVSSGFFFVESLSYYDFYDNSFNIQDRNDHFDRAREYGVYSFIALSAAATIWVLDYGTILFSPNNSRQYYKNQGSLSLKYDPISNKPLLALTVKF